MNLLKDDIFLAIIAITMGVVLFSGMVLTIMATHLNVYNKPQCSGRYNAPNYPLWLGNTKFRNIYTLSGLLGFYFCISATLILAFDFEQESIAFHLLLWGAVFIEYILCKGYNAFVKDIRAKKYRKKLDLLKSDKHIGLISEEEFQKQKENLFKYKD